MPGATATGEAAVDGFTILKNRCRDSLQRYLKAGKIYAAPFDYIKRLEHELVVFKGSGYSDVILIISEYIQWARGNGIVVGPGRGSAAGSLVVFLSGITTIDPMRFGLIFERFLNPERISLPDIDTDFSDRDAVIDHVSEIYGVNRVAKVGVPSLFKPRSAIDELARLHEMEYIEAKRITKLIGDAKTFEQAFKESPQLADYESKYPEIFRIARILQGFVRQVTTHPSAVILTRGPIGSEIPMSRAPGEDAGKKGVLVTSWDGEELDSLGYVKLDILTVDNLSIINKCIDSLGRDEEGNKKIDFYDLDIEDRYALDGFTAGETVAVFQFEEPKSVAILQQMERITFEEVCAVNALIRPGLDVSHFLDARNTGNTSYLIPELEPILSETNGVILYQEQVMRMCVELAGFSMAKADKFRKIIAKTANQRIDFSSQDKIDFKQGYLSKGLPEEKFEELWAKILACQNYIFNKSHAVCYGYIAYADMFLKRHYPLQFMCAALQTRSKEAYVKECDRLGIRVLRPDVNLSEENYSIEGDSIRMGLTCIKHIGAKAKQIIARRPYSDEFDFLDRAKPNAKQIEALCYAGAMDCFDERDKVTARFTKKTLNEVVSIGELASGEKEALGFYLLFNPLAQFDNQLQHCITPESTRFPMDALVGGMVSKVKEHQAKTGMMAFVTLLTVDGEMDIIIWPSDWPSEKRKFALGNVIIGNGKRTDKGNYSVKDANVLSRA